ncbi:MAG: FecR domain-containing protein [Gammaproteobacteria bacterium]|nr:FecR domain-containing protein [Gammaproteobacteria bacterium]MBU1625722.1 FecR domain-containing protein [Gammaproteobacteria bacterium]MBU1980982.1 FecR domain-containing protein [Gammaproteobacteria bacterium]
MKKILQSLILSCFLLGGVNAYAADSAGTIRYMSGTLVAQRTDGTVRVLTSKSSVQPGDLLVTGRRSYAQVLMRDGTKMTMRPDSNLKIEAYEFQQSAPKNDNAIFRLLKGGFRTVTGLIGKRGNKDAYKLRASGATIGIRGTDFTSRLCATKGCEDDADAVKPVAKPKPAGRVMRIAGQMVAKQADGNIRKLTLGSPVFEGDTLQSDMASHAVVAFRDGGRITLQQSSIFKVEAFKYEKKGGVQENIALRLIKGGVRVVTGLIGRANRNNYKFRMSGATIGIRGTGFDAWCNGPCASDTSSPVASTGEPLNNTLWSQYAEVQVDGRLSDAGMQTSVSGQYTQLAEGPADPMNGAGVYVWSGEVVFVGPGGSFTVAVNQAAMIAQQTGKPVRILNIPAAVLQNDVPRPDGVPVDLDKLFDEAQAEGDAGLYVTVHDGQVILQKGDQQVDLGKGESGFTNDDILTRLASTPDFMGGDANMDNIEQNDGGGDQGCVVR